LFRSQGSEGLRQALEDHRNGEGIINPLEDILDFVAKRVADDVELEIMSKVDLTATFQVYFRQLVARLTQKFSH
jgi:hypothetical protein